MDSDSTMIFAAVIVAIMAGNAWRRKNEGAPPPINKRLLIVMWVVVAIAAGAGVLAALSN